MRDKRLFIPAALAALLGAPALAQDGINIRPDINRDGKVTQAEALQVAELRFEASDLNGDGLLSLEEVRTAALTRFANQDADGDGEVTRRELRAAFKASR